MIALLFLVVVAILLAWLTLHLLGQPAAVVVLVVVLLLGAIILVSSSDSSSLHCC